MGRSAAPPLNGTVTCPQNSCSPATSVARLIDQRLSLRAITSAYRLSPPNSSPTRPPFPDLEECKTRNRRSKQIYRARERSVDNWTAPCGNPGNSSLDEIRQVQALVNPALRRCKSGMIVEQKCPTICLYHGANHCHAFGCFVGREPTTRIPGTTMMNATNADCPRRIWWRSVSTFGASHPEAQENAQGNRPNYRRKKRYRQKVT